MKSTTRLVISYVGCGIALIGMACFAVLASAAPIGEAEVRQCVQEILQRAGGGVCSNYFTLESVKKADARETSNEAFVIGDIDFRVKQRLGGKSQAATQCTGTGWRVETKNPYPPNTGQWFMYQSQADMDGGYLEPGQGLRVRKNFKFEHWESGWRCSEAQMNPVDQIWFVNTPTPAQQPQPGSLLVRKLDSAVEHKGKVLSTVDTPVYIYIEVEQDDKTVWLATRRPVAAKQGDTIRFNEIEVWTNYKSKVLGRTFPTISLVKIVGDQ